MLVNLDHFPQKGVKIKEEYLSCHYPVIIIIIIIIIIIVIQSLTELTN